MLPTQKLYQTVDRTQYDALKQRHVSGLSPTYSGLPVRAKWALLMGELTRIFPNDEQTVFDFHRARLETVERAGNISLADCLSYFEQFYFLYTTTEPCFKLNDKEKEELKRLILSGMGVACEPGKQERFELALALYRRDTNWIDGRLSQARYHVLERIAESCNVALHIGDGMSPHTIKFMKGLAEAKQLGIDREVALTDVYIIETVGITTYFETHYSRAYREFEAHAADDLAQQLLNELTEFLRGNEISMAQWDQEGLVISVDHQLELLQFFESKSFDAIMVDLRDDSDEEHLKFKKKADFIAGLQSLVRKSLLQNGYCVSLSAPNATPGAEVPSLPVWHAGVSMQDVLAFMQALESESVDVLTLLNRYEAVLLQYPKTVLRFIARKPSILSALPDACRINDLFIREVITIVNARLLVAIEERDSEKIDPLIGLLLPFLRTSYDDFSQFDNAVLNHPLVAQALVKRCGFLLKQLPESMRRNKTVVQAAIEQNGLALCFASHTLQRDADLIQRGLDKLTASFGDFGVVEVAHWTLYQARVLQIYKRYKNQLPPLIQAEFNVEVGPAFIHPDLIHARLRAIQKMQALHELYSAPFIGALKLATLAQSLTPAELLLVFQYRKDQHLSPLPYCDHLEAFRQNLVDEGCDWLSGGYLAARQRAQAVSEAAETSGAVGFLARTNHWYVALVQHHRANQLGFRTMKQFLKQVQKTIQVTFEFMWLLLKFMVFWLGVGSIYFSICCCIGFVEGFVLGVFIAAVIIPMVFAEAAFLGITSLVLLDLMFFIHIVAAISLIGAVVAILCPIVLPVLDCIGLYINLMFHEIDRIFNVSFYVDQIYRGMGDFLPVQESMQGVVIQVHALMKNIYATLVSPAAPPLPTDTLAARCERSMERLMFTEEDASANQKGALLSMLWDKIQEEGPCASEDVLKGRLNKKYEVSYQGQARQVSFFEVASTKRASSDRFLLDQPPSAFGFFSKRCATTTDSMLDCARPVMAA